MMTPAPKPGGVDGEVEGPLSQNASIAGAEGAGGEETLSKKGPLSGETLGRGSVPVVPCVPELHRELPPPVMRGPARPSPLGPSRYPDANTVGGPLSQGPAGPSGAL